MKVMERLAQAREDADSMAQESDGRDATEEEVMRQFAFCVVSDFIEHDGYRVIEDLLDPDYEVHNAIAEWVDA